MPSSSFISQIEHITKSHAWAELTTETELSLYLRSWWSKLYNRPLKDPVLDAYTLEELLYEFFDNKERARAAESKAEEERDKIEDNKYKSALDWAEEEEKKELEAQAGKDETWMREQLQKDKQVFGDDYGEDLNLDFTRESNGQEDI